MVSTNPKQKTLSKLHGLSELYASGYGGVRTIHPLSIHPLPVHPLPILPLVIGIFGIFSDFLALRRVLDMVLLSGSAIIVISSPTIAAASEAITVDGLQPRVLHVSFMRPTTRLASAFPSWGSWLWISVVFTKNESDVTIVD